VIVEDGTGVIARIETPAMARLIGRLGVPAVDLRGTVQGIKTKIPDGLMSL
jgi:hypothetical protein